jgi:hypothetical protein
MEVIKPKILFYYQTFTGLQPILCGSTPVTHIHLSSIHFGVETDGRPYIHLNNESPYSDKFDNVWKELEQASALGIKIKIMVGGPGGGYETLFSNFPVYYALLADLLRNKPVLSGVDLDIEEYCAFDDVKMFIRTLKKDFGNKISISMAPVQSSLEEDFPGMGGFIYKDILQSPEGKLIDYFNVQFYSDFSASAFDKIVTNGYLPEMIVMGALAGEKNDSEIAKCVKKYKERFGGVFVWEYCFAKPSPSIWATDIQKIYKSSLYEGESFIQKMDRLLGFNIFS